ncbi:MAG: hypothetical protein ACOX5Z_00130 [Desulfobulbus sp.]|jgi:hypothetical protein
MSPHPRVDQSGLLEDVVRGLLAQEVPVSVIVSAFAGIRSRRWVYRARKRLLEKGAI